MLSAIERHSRKMATLHELLSCLQHHLSPWVWLLGYWVAVSWLTQVHSFIASSQSQGWDVPDPNLNLCITEVCSQGHDRTQKGSGHLIECCSYFKLQSSIRKKNMFWLVNLSNAYKPTALTPNVCLLESHTSFCWATSLFWSSALPPTLPLQTSSETDVH